MNQSHAQDLGAVKSRELRAASPCLPAMSAEAVARVCELEGLSLNYCEQVEFPMEHLIHAGMYARTLHMKAGEFLTGALLRVATTLIVSGDCTVFVGEETIELRGYTVLPGSAGRKQVFVAHTGVSMTMIFPTKATTISDAEREATNDFARLPTNFQSNTLKLITGE